MTLLIIVSVCVFTAIGIVLISYGQAKLFISRIGKNDQMTVEVKALFGLLKYKFDVPVIRYVNIFQGVKVKEKTEGSPKEHPETNEIQLDKDKIVAYFRNSKDFLKSVNHFDEWLKQSLSLVHCTELKWVSYVGLGDAMESAVTTGLVWGLKSSVLGYGLKFVRLDKQPKISVWPVYNKPHFSTELYCIVKIRIGYAIFAGLLLYVRTLQTKGGNQPWQNTLSKA